MRTRVKSPSFHPEHHGNTSQWDHTGERRLEQGSVWWFWAFSNLHVYGIPVWIKPHLLNPSVVVGRVHNWRRQSEPLAEPPVHCRPRYECLWNQYLAQRYFVSALKMLWNLPLLLGRLPCFALGLESRTLHFSTDWATTPHLIKPKHGSEMSYLLKNTKRGKICR